MASFKAADPDGMPALFLKTYWATLGDDIVATVKNFFLTRNLHPYLNKRNIVIIPTGQNSSSINQFRPIAICNVIYKIISKILSNRVLPLLDKLIFLTQNDFVSDRSIHENSVLIQKVIYAMKRKIVAYGCMDLKIDLQKAYNYLSWTFLKAVLSAFGFHQNWIN